MGKTKNKQTKNKKNQPLKLIISPTTISPKATLQSVVESNSGFGTVNTKLHPNGVPSSWVLPLMVSWCHNRRNTDNNVNINKSVHCAIRGLCAIHSNRRLKTTFPTLLTFSFNLSDIPKSDTVNAKYVKDFSSSGSFNMLEKCYRPGMLQGFLPVAFPPFLSQRQQL